MELSVTLFAPTSTMVALLVPTESARLPLKLQRWRTAALGGDPSFKTPAAITVSLAVGVNAGKGQYSGADFVYSQRARRIFDLTVECAEGVVAADGQRDRTGRGVVHRACAGQSVYGLIVAV